MTKIIITALALLLIIFVSVRYFCNGEKIYMQNEIDAIAKNQEASKKEYEDSLDFARGQAELQHEANLAHQERIIDLEKEIDSLIKRHNITKKKIKPFDTSGISAMLVPNEYVDECETCFSKLQKYKEENIQLKFERDSYDSLMRIQNEINEKRIRELDGEKMIFNKMYNDCVIRLNNNTGVNRKLKAGMMGMLNYEFSPNGIGPGLIYEDKKDNEFGAHVLFTNAGNIYLLHIAKTISLKRKR